MRVNKDRLQTPRHPTNCASRRDAWTPFEIEQLAEGLRLSETNETLALRLSPRSNEAIRRKIVLLQRADHWTVAELQALHDGVAAGKTAVQIATDLPTRTLRAVRAQLLAYNLKAKAMQIGPGPLPDGSKRSNKFSWVKQDNKENWTERKCMTCNAKFLSWGIGNRLCPEHRREG
jgi:ParB-like chromosome segregation protein Spo0J